MTSGQLTHKFRERDVKGARLVRRPVIADFQTQGIGITWLSGSEWHLAYAQIERVVTQKVEIETRNVHTDRSGHRVPCVGRAGNVLWVVIGSFEVKIAIRQVYVEKPVGIGKVQTA